MSGLMSDSCKMFVSVQVYTQCMVCVYSSSKHPFLAENSTSVRTWLVAPKPNPHLPHSSPTCTPSPTLPLHRSRLHLVVFADLYPLYPLVVEYSSFVEHPVLALATYPFGSLHSKRLFCSFPVFSSPKDLAYTLKGFSCITKGYSFFLFLLVLSSISVLRHK